MSTTSSQRVESNPSLSDSERSLISQLRLADDSKKNINSENHNDGKSENHNEILEKIDKIVLLYIKKEANADSQIKIEVSKIYKENLTELNKLYSQISWLEQIKLKISKISMHNSLKC